MYSGSCSSVKSNRTLDRGDDGVDDDEDESQDEDDSGGDGEDDDDDDDTEVENNATDEKVNDDDEEEDAATDDGEHYSSLVTHVMHQRAFTSTSMVAETETTEEEVFYEAESSATNDVIENTPIIVENQVYVMEDSVAEMNDPQQNLMEVSPGAATASEIFRHLQATHGKEEITTELAKILNVLHTTLKEEESSSSGSGSNTGSGSEDSESRSSTDDEREPKRQPELQVTKISQPSAPAATAVQKPALPPQAPLGKPPKYPCFKNRTLGPEIEDRIKELSAPKQGRSGKEEMQILSKILVTLLCSCRSAAATQQLKKIIRHFKEAASEAGDEFGNDDFDLRSSTSSRSKRRGRRRRRRRWSSGANSSHSSHGSEADSQTNTLTPCNTDSKSSGTDDERDNNQHQPLNQGKGASDQHSQQVSTRLRFNVVVEDPPTRAGGNPETNVTFTISLPRRSSIEMSAEASYSTSQFYSGAHHQEEINQEIVEEEEEEEWEWEEDEDTGENDQRQDSTDSCGSLTTRKLLTDMECGAYNSDSLGSPSAGTSGPSGEQSNNQSPSAIESRPESSNDLTRKRIHRSRENSSSSNNNLFTHLEETFKVLNGAYKIITGSKPEPTSAEIPEARDKDLDSKRSFEEVLENVSNEVAHLENEIRKSTSRPASRPASRPTSKMSTSSRRAASRNCGGDEDYDEDDEDGWEYYYEDEEEEEIQIASKTPVPEPLPNLVTEPAPVLVQPVHKADHTLDSKSGPQIGQKQPEEPSKSRPSSRQARSRPGSRAGSRPNSRLRTKTPMGNVIMEGDENAADDDWEWEYYYEEGEEDELRLSPTATTAPTTRATSPFPHELQRANIVSPTTLWEEIFGPAITFRPPEIGLARESIHVDPNSMCDSMISVALAAEYLGHSAVDLAATLPPNFMQDDKEERKRRKDKKEKKKHRKDRDGKFLPKVGVKELANRLEPRLFQDVETGTKMVMDKNVASSVIAKQKKISSKIGEVVASQIQQQQQQKIMNTAVGHQQQQQQQQMLPPMEQKKVEAPIIVHDAGNPNQVTVHQGGQSTVVMMRRSGGARTKEPIKILKQRSPSEGSEAYGTGSTTSAIEQPHVEDEEDHNEDGRGSSRHSRLFRLLQDSDYTDSETESRSEFGSGHRISLKGVDDLVANTKDTDLDSVCSIERKHSFRSMKSSGKESDCDSITSSGRGIGGGGDRSTTSMQKEMAVKRFMTLNLQSRDLYASSSELSTPTSPTYPYAPVDCPQMMSPERRRASQFRNGFEDASRGPAQQMKSGLRLAGNSPRTSGDLYRGSPIRNSPKLELELLELANLPSAPSFTMRNLHTRPGKL